MPTQPSFFRPALLALAISLSLAAHTAVNAIFYRDLSVPGSPILPPPWRMRTVSPKRETACCRWW